VNRSRNRILKFSRQQIERRIERLKRRMNKFYQEILACEQALKYFEIPTTVEIEEAKAKEQLLRQQIVAAIEETKEELKTAEPIIEPVTKPEVL